MKLTLKISSGNLINNNKTLNNEINFTCFFFIPFTF